MALSFSHIKRDIQQKNYTEIPFHLSREKLKTAAQSFLDFLALSQDIKNALHTDWNVREHFSDVGYVRRTSENGKDDKEFFHYNEVIDKKFGEIFHVAEPEVQNFLHHARLVYDEAKNTLQKLLAIFEEEFPAISKMFFQEDEIPFLYLRFLKYDSKEKGDFLARAHYDRGTLTFALAESAPGLRIGRSEESLQEVAHKEKTAFFMPAIHFEEITNSEFTPAWHDVVQRSRDNTGKDFSRWAIVFFADALHMKTPNPQETHTQKYY